MLGSFLGSLNFDIGLFLGAFWCRLGALFSSDLATLKSEQTMRVSVNLRVVVYKYFGGKKQKHFQKTCLLPS